MSQITTHILDTTKGKPAPGVNIVLFQQMDNEWKQVAKSITNDDGRVADLLNKDIVMETGTYKMKFETAAYFEKQNMQSFYPFIEIIFTIFTNEHYHIPLLLNPYGYSTYRGS
jgi:5-hydroxyisourate hydrolase